MRPKAFGALLDGLVEALRNEEREVSGLPRMADFAEFAMKCETAYWPSGTFARAYAKNRKGVGEAMLDADIMATVLRRWWADYSVGRWEGTASELLAALGNAATERERAAPSWPKDHRVLGQMLRRAMPLLRDQGIEVNPDHWFHDRRKIVISNLAPNGLAPEPTSVGQNPVPTTHTFQIPSVGVDPADPGAQSEDDYWH